MIEIDLKIWLDCEQESGQQINQQLNFSMVSAEVDESVEVTTSPTNADTQELMINGHEDTSESIQLVNIG